MSVNQWAKSQIAGSSNVDKTQAKAISKAMALESLDDQALEILDKHTAPAFSKGTPTSNVFMYAFSMKPEHVSNPSGHVNMSRIRQQVLEINMRPDPVYEKQLSIYAVNYNILRVQYGLGGLLFNSSQ